MHLATELALAAPDNRLPSLLTAACWQHRLMKLVFASPASGFPSLLPARAGHDWERAPLVAKAITKTASTIRFMAFPPWQWLDFAYAQLPFIHPKLAVSYRPN